MIHFFFGGGGGGKKENKEIAIENISVCFCYIRLLTTHQLSCAKEIPTEHCVLLDYCLQLFLPTIPHAVCLLLNENINSVSNYTWGY